MKMRVCPICNKEFYTGKDYTYKINKHKIAYYCSYTCFRKAERLFNDTHLVKTTDKAIS